MDWLNFRTINHALSRRTLCEKPDTMNHTLTITTDDGKEVVKVSIGELDPLTATLTVITALQASQPRKRRADAGVPRKTTEEVQP